MRNNFFWKGKLVLLLSVAFLFTGCYSVFSGGTGGRVVDSESSESPKAGIADVDVYAYTDEKKMKKDFDSWDGVSRFVPGEKNYYGHTVTESDGSFSISKLLWKSYFSDFGKDADYSKVYLLFYHENYGLVKGQTLIVSDSYSDTVYQELTAVRKTTVVNFSLYDVAKNSNVAETVRLSVSVPQSSGVKVYDATITGSGAVKISYPRYLSSADKASGRENEPKISVSYVQTDEEVSWKSCWNDDATNGYKFKNEASEATVRGNACSVKLYGKYCRISLPSINGTVGDGTSAANDGRNVVLKDGTTEISRTSTGAVALGTGGTEKHGVYSALGSGCYWTDDSYAEKIASKTFKVECDGSPDKDVTIQSNDPASLTVNLN